MKKQNGSVKVVTLLLLVLALLAGTGAYYAASHFVVTTERGRIVLPKRFLTFTDTCADIRGWTYEVSQQHPEVCLALRKAGFGDLLPKGPSFLDRATSKAIQAKNATVQATTNAWSKAKAKFHELTSAEAPAAVSVTNVPASVATPAK